MQLSSSYLQPRKGPLRDARWQRESAPVRFGPRLRNGREDGLNNPYSPLPGARATQIHPSISAVDLVARAPDGVPVMRRSHLYLKPFLLATHSIASTPAREPLAHTRTIV
ncbi:hypothetical protein BHE74_00012174 [Ensete ventricosum]|nr:hypothetical protein BHE74_00012174 [Ensete ventricosum]